MLPFTYHFYKVQDVFLKLFIAITTPTALRIGANEKAGMLKVLEGAQSAMAGKYKAFYDAVAYSASQTNPDNIKMPIFAALVYLKQLLQEEPPPPFSFCANNNN